MTPSDIKMISYLYRIAWGSSGFGWRGRCRLWGNPSLPSSVIASRVRAVAKFSKVQPCAAADGWRSPNMPRRLPPASANRAVTAFIHLSKEPRRRLAQPNDVGQWFFCGGGPTWGGGQKGLPLGGRGPHAGRLWGKGGLPYTLYTKRKQKAPVHQYKQDTSMKPRH